jgi:ubiquitin-conjugating enzyme E2 A
VIAKRLKKLVFQKLLSDDWIVRIGTHFTMTKARRRLMTDLKNLRRERPDGVDAAPQANSIFTWRGTIRGPPGTPWEGEDLEVALRFPDTYPLDPPDVRFLENICHPNVYPDGRVCVDILKHSWNPNNDVLSILISLQAFLDAPNFRSWADPETLLFYSALIATFGQWSWETMTHEDLEALLAGDRDDHFSSRLEMFRQCFERGSVKPPSLSDIHFVAASLAGP